MKTPSRAVYVATAALASSVLALEIALTRIFSVLTWHHFTYMIISISLLGFGAAGSWLTVRKESHPEVIEPKSLAQSALWYAAATLISFAIVTQLPFELQGSKVDSWQLLKVLIIDLALAAPFFFAGRTIAGIITAWTADVHRIYFADLLGGSLGALASVGLVRVLGAPNTVVLTALLAACAAWLLRREADSPTPMIFPAAVAGLGLLLVGGVVVNPYLVHGPPSKVMHNFANRDIGSEGLDFSKWHVVARIDISDPIDSFQIPGFGGDLGKIEGGPETWEFRMVFQDAAAPTYILKSDGDIEKMVFLDGFLQSLPHTLKDDHDALVIGVGGGIDLLLALYHGAGHVTGAEINPVTVGALSNEYLDYSGRLLERDDVDVHVAEGRHFVTSTDKTFDVIQLSGVDTFSALSSGAYALAESYLYTNEAIEAFLARLNPGGILSFSRWYLRPPRETLRLVGMMRVALEERGIEDVQKHFVVVAGPEWAETLVKLDPFTPEEVAGIHAWATERGFEFLYDPHQRGDNEFDTMLRTSAEEQAAFMEEYVYRVEPSTDDSPFYFNYYKWRHMFRADDTVGGYTPTQLPLGLLTLTGSIGQIFFLAFLGILLPMRKTELFDRPGRGGVLLYFGSLGMGFMLLEISLIQQLMVFLGGPSYSLAVTLFAILLFGGLGSRFSKRWADAPAAALPKIFAALLVLILLEALLLDVVVGALLGLPWAARVVAAAIALAPMAFVMGMPFPTGLAVLGDEAPGWVPWAWAINAFMTVLGPLVCIVLSMETGFDVVFGVSAAVYAIGFLGFRGIARGAAAA